jgi:EAL domain-containing protein (putative c-di-GMP-specific phosphodiesterase class I)
LKNLLLSLDCDMMQGYLFSRPLPSDAATELLLNNVNR